MRNITWQEIPAMAVAMEEKGRDFYLQLAERAGNPKVAEMFKHFAAEEEAHAETFKRGLPGWRPEDPGTQEAAYLAALFPGEVEYDVLHEPVRALAVAAEAEKSAILFYTELYNQVPEEAARGIISRILKEEKMHLIEVRERLEEGWD